MDNALLHLKSCSFSRSGNDLGNGGALHIKNGLTIIEDCTFDSNTALFGGAIYFSCSETGVEIEC